LRARLPLALTVLFACGGGADAPPEEPVASTPPRIVVETDAFDVAPGDEILMCTVTDQVLAADFDVVTVHSYQQAGGHHAAFFYTTEPLAPGPTHRCAEHETMNWQFVGAGAEGMEVGLTLPPGVAIRVPKGARVVVESHYVNPSADVHHVQDRVTAEGPANPATIVARADVFQVTDFAMQIPPHVAQKRVIECVLEDDMTALDLNGHAHQFADVVRVSVLRVGATLPETLYDQPWEPRFQFTPPVIQYPVPGHALPRFSRGDRMRVECDWRNTTERTLTFPSEMCIGTIHYLPGRGYVKCGAAIQTVTTPLPSP
jgi:hypothetical protein